LNSSSSPSAESAVGTEPTITIEAKVSLTSLACRKAKDLGYPHELWTTRFLARHGRKHGPAQGHGCLNLAQGTVCKILDQEGSSDSDDLCAMLAWPFGSLFFGT
jgi:hypothetical protein